MCLLTLQSPESLQGDNPQPTSSELPPKAAVELNNTIILVAATAEKDLESLGPSPSFADAKVVLEKLLSAFNDLLDVHREEITELNLVTMLHRTVSIVAGRNLQTWLVKGNEEFMKRLLSQVRKQR